LRMEPPPPPPPPIFGELSFGEPGRTEREMAMAETAPSPGPPDRTPMPAGARRPRRGNGFADGNPAGNGEGRERGGPRPAAPRSPWAGTPRNAACPCGSGKKFKHCHGRI
jgi:preprotein translocase subunit SecA